MGCMELQLLNLLFSHKSSPNYRLRITKLVRLLISPYQFSPFLTNQLFF